MGPLVTVTALFTDLVGSTSLESRVGPVVADELRADYFSLLREALVDTGGREVKSTGDGVMAVFPSAAAAVDRKSTRLNSSHANISYAVFCLKKKKIVN